MSYIEFDKDQLVNLEYSLTRELLRSNRAGSYSSTTIIGCNTRKYHGLLITPQPQLDGGMHVLLSNLDESVIQQNTEFNLAIHRYKGGIYNPKGHKYITDFKSDPIPTITYRVGGVILTKEMLFVSNSDQIIIKYTLVAANSPTSLRFRPFLAYRNIHSLSKANNDVERKYDPISNGIKVRMYQGYPYLHLQFSKDPEYIHVPDWYYNFTYTRERARGYDYVEDLFTPGFFEMPISVGESIYFVAGLEPENPASLAKLFNAESKRRIPRDSFEHCLQNAAQQFLVKRGKRDEVIAGFPWFGRVARDSFISLPGLTLLQGDFKTFKGVFDTLVSEMKGPLFPNFGSGLKVEYNAVDSSLWMFWALQQYAMFSGDKNIWKQYGPTMKMILTSFRQGASFNIHMLENGLLYAGIPGVAVTWMDAVVDGKPVTPRIGMAVEVNALWYNAIRFSLELAEEAKDKQFILDWKDIAAKIPASFVSTFWFEDKKYLADFVHGDQQSRSVRPNQIFAVSLPYSPLDDDQRKGVIDRVQSELLTPRGLRTLSPKNPLYKPEYTGNQAERDMAYHQGSVFPWLLGHFAEAYLKIYEKSGISFVEKIYNNFEEVMPEHGIGTISELYDGDPPHRPSGAISQAWSVAELLRIRHLIDQAKGIKSKVKKERNTKSPK
ncbi:MAG: glycogen debranching enzyme N-terminal domain-containing protein [Bacteroidetes bacterium]|nr:glycogen debranching enzyme N-terminal domain-containing protein [Bacteroidota bacterium]